MIAANANHQTLDRYDQHHHDNDLNSLQYLKFHAAMIHKLSILFTLSHPTRDPIAQRNKSTPPRHLP